MNDASSNLPKVAYLSQRGRRANNQDMYGIPRKLVNRPLDDRGAVYGPDSRKAYHPKGFIFLLADGVGGTAGGDLASELVVKEVGQRYYADPSSDIATSLRQVIQAANLQLRRARQNSDLNRMSTTLVAAVFYREAYQKKMLIAGVGDSRAYRLRGKHLELLSHDHSWVQEQVDRRAMSPSEAEVSPQRHRITRSMGSKAQVEIDMWQVDLQPGDRMLLCSDGLSGYMTDHVMAKLAQHPNLQTAVNQLVDTAYDQGSHDNISAVLIDPGWSS